MQIFGNFTQPLPDPRLLIITDERNPKAADAAAPYRSLVKPQPNLIMVFGGDGFMLRTVRRLWHKRLPFFGVNVGHLGFLLNEPSLLHGRLPEHLHIHHLPFLEVSVHRTDGKRRNVLAFNDAWVERAKSQTAWIEVRQNREIRLDRLVADGALVATPAGSTAYASAMGASPLPLDAQALVLAGSNVAEPIGFRPCYLSLNSEILLRAADPIKRPLNGVVDGINLGRVSSLHIAVSPTATVQLAFGGSNGLAEKLARKQFPSQVSS